MSNLFGTIINVKDFLSIEEARIRIRNITDQEIVIELKAGRQYKIPDFQREIRWAKEHLIELLRDINKNSKFLGNIILTKSGDKDFYVIDGQQRITILLMLINYLRYKFSGQFTIDETCEIINDSFLLFDDFAQKQYCIEKFSSSEKITILESDKYGQINSFNKLWEAISSVDILNKSTNARNFYDNLKRCEFNVIITNEESTGLSTEYFLDVNLKGVKLDNEDIFKGYLFSLDNSQEIRNEWVKLKQTSNKLNEDCMKINKTTEESYPLMKIIEHYLYCNLFLDEKFEKVVFNDSFLLTKAVSIESETHYIGEHIIKVINNNNYFLNGLKKINEFLEIIINIINSETPSLSFKTMINSARLDSIEIGVIHNFARRIILEPNLVIPKALLMKYFLAEIIANNNMIKDDIRKIYAICLYGNLFSIFENRKSISKMSHVLKASNWYVNIVDEVKDYFDRSKLADRRVIAQFKFAIDGDNEEQNFRSKSLAAIYNFFRIVNSKVSITSGKMNELSEFLTNNERFSTEHFIINNSDKFKIILPSNIEKEFFYTNETKKYSKSIFNYIFVSRDINKLLDNHFFDRKLIIIDSKIEEIQCEYSKMVIEIAKKIFANLPLYADMEQEQEIIDIFGSFYGYEFKNRYPEYIKEIITKLIEHFPIN